MTAQELDGLDVVVVGGGVVGLAIARALQARGREVIVLESEGRLGVHTSSRNSEVIHAGIYYPTGSLKARFCVQGKQALYEYCENAGVNFRKLGKLIVCTDEAQINVLEALRRQAAENEVLDLVWLDARAIRELEPAVRAVCGLFSPSTGIIDSHGFMTALKRDAEAFGAKIVTSSPVTKVEVSTGGFLVTVGGVEPSRVHCQTLINAAGLNAPAVARTIRGLPKHTVPRAYYAKGHYFTLTGPSPFRHLVYPVPSTGGLGVHVTLDLSGQTRFGPDVAWIDGIDYSFDDSRAPSFCDAVRSYYPAIELGRLQPGYTGIRPKIAGPGKPAADFSIHGPLDHGIQGLVNLYGIESPGLTASLAIAEWVAGLL